MEIIMNDVLKKISDIGIVPVVVLDDAKDAKPLAQALIAGGLPCAEVTFRTAAAEESIKIMTEAFPDMLVGAGTVLTTEQADRAINAGAKFIVSPGFNEKIVKYCLDKGVPMVPGINNPTGIEAALELGELPGKSSEPAYILEQKERICYELIEFTGAHLRIEHRSSAEVDNDDHAESHKE